MSGKNEAGVVFSKREYYLVSVSINRLRRPVDLIDSVDCVDHVNPVDAIDYVDLVDCRPEIKLTPSTV